MRIVNFNDIPKIITENEKLIAENARLNDLNETLSQECESLVGDVEFQCEHKDKAHRDHQQALDDNERLHKMIEDKNSIIEGLKRHHQTEMFFEKEKVDIYKIALMQAEQKIKNYESEDETLTEQLYERDQDIEGLRKANNELWAQANKVGQLNRDLFDYKTRELRLQDEIRCLKETLTYYRTKIIPALGGNHL